MIEAGPQEDHGFSGPDSVMWRVWSYPTSIAVGFIRDQADARTHD